MKRFQLVNENVKKHFSISMPASDNNDRIKKQHRRRSQIDAS